MSGDVWECLGMSGDVWACLGMSGDVWGCLDLVVQNQEEGYHLQRRRSSKTEPGSNSKSLQHNYNLTRLWVQLALVSENTYTLWVFTYITV